jgi:hypothetical protein
MAGPDCSNILKKNVAVKASTTSESLLQSRTLQSPKQSIYGAYPTTTAQMCSVLHIKFTLILLLTFRKTSVVATVLMSLRVASLQETVKAPNTGQRASALSTTLLMWEAWLMFVTG